MVEKLLQATKYMKLWRAMINISWEKKKKQKMHTDDRTRQEEGLHRFKSDKRQIVEERNDCHEKFRHIK